MRAILHSIVGAASRPVRFWVAALVIVASVILVSILAIPERVSVDGILYISSAKSFFSDDFASTYAWFREPGYPFFLAVVHLIGNAGVLVVIAQAFCLGISAFIGLYVALRSLGRTTVPLGTLLLMEAFALNPMYLIYAALFLQQAQLTLQLALVALFVSWAFRRPAWLPAWALVAFTVLNYVLCIWTSIGWIYLALLPTALVIVVTLWKAFRGTRVLRRPRVSALAVVAASIIAVLAVYGSGLAIYSGWSAIRTANSAAAVGIPTTVIKPLDAVPYIPTPYQMGQRYLALMHIGTVNLYVEENSLFLQDQLIRGYPHSEYDTAYDSPPYSTFARDYFVLTDPVPALFRPYSIVARVAGVLYAGVYVSSFLVLVGLILRRKWELLAVALVPFYFLGVYAASGSPIDRYGVPGYPLAAAAVAVTIAAVLGWFTRRWATRKA